MVGAAKELGIWLLIATVFAAGVYVTRDNRQLRTQVAALSRQVREPRAGLFVPPYEAETLDGDRAELGRLGERQLLFFFNTSCQHCRASLPAWRQIAAELEGDSAVRVYGVALDSVDATIAYTSDNPLGFPVVARPDPRLAAYYRVGGVPAVILVDENGRMGFARLGRLDTRTAIDSVLTAVHRPLPTVVDSLIGGVGR